MNHIEMGISDLDVLATKLSSIKEYNTMFSNAFGNEEITKEKIATGLSAFLLSIRSNQSKFDKSVNFAITNSLTNNSVPQVGLQLTAIEELGRQLFFDKFACNSCHESNGFADIGLDSNPKDLGMSSITGMSGQAGMFKIPSLRNVELTGPYMHDGRFKTLDEVLQHYSHGISNSTNLDERLRENGKAKQMNMTEVEVKAIISFLTTLTDYEMVTDPKLSNPFKAK
jgi:cytochrome c peroxidase